MKKSPSIFGGACIIASVCVGAGMLGLPTSGAGAWTIWSTLIICLTMVVMTLSGWLLLEAYKHFDLRASFNTVTKSLLGNTVNVINNLSVYFVGGILLYAYTTASGGILSELMGNFMVLDSRIWSIIFVLFFSFFVWHSTRIVDRVSVILIIFMALSFIFSVFGLTANIDIGTLFDTQAVDADYAMYAMGLLPVALTSFGYHHSVATMRAYYGEERKAKLAILGGTMIALSLYLLWVWSIFGNLPRNQFAPVIASDGNLDVLLQALGNVIESSTVKQAINAFSIAAILSSFIGVGLGVFDFLADLFKFDDSKLGRTKSWAVTFLPPLILSVLFPLGFLKAIGYAGAVATIWACAIPALLAGKSRTLAKGKSGFIVGGGSVTILLVIIFGIVTALFHFLAMFNMLPTFKG
ncbi:transposase [Ursidibacter maritimus]|uniref:Aromatic amino acid permease n=1 Tax=Ursidibacter maritimus TaxID=1331689 RepID=A0A949T2W3_9PAST|nr:aromatic amino acid transporter [Ursidibacter maritimus]KAE9542197.1 transposase [Ursidibacter maritimus]MBV6524291.1 transposase [Ursidibacter maritimus]MBV6526195.1 transposase [Ursidibacter maritimus]MBV6528274.1 transposase [Ursidibacter maritimus]MBV6529686.1 transposase [Ursidibacter maritimus]